MTWKGEKAEVREEEHLLPTDNRDPRGFIKLVGMAVVLWAVLFGVLWSALGADVTPGYTFSDGERNVTHTKLNQAAAGSINTTFYTDKAATSEPDAASVLLLFDPGSTTFKKATLQNLVFDHDELLKDRTEVAGALSTNDVFLVWRESAEEYQKVDWEGLSNQVVNAAGIALTNVRTNLEVQVTNALTNVVVGVSENLRVWSTNGVDVECTADEVLLKSAAGIPLLVTDVSWRASLAQSGTNGLDAGSEANATWYYLFCIANGTNTPSGLFSTSATTPTLPAGWDYFALVGVCYNETNGVVREFEQWNRKQWFGFRTIVGGKKSSGNMEWLTGSDLTAFRETVPPLAKTWWGAAGRTDDLTGTQGVLEIAAHTNRLGGVFISGRVDSTPALLWTLASPVPEIPILSGVHNFAWRSSSTSTSNRVGVTGFSF